MGHPDSPSVVSYNLLKDADPSSRRQLVGNTIYGLVGVDPRVFFGDLERLDQVLLETLARHYASDVSCANFDKLIEHINCTEPGTMSMILVNLLAVPMLAQLIEDLP